MLLKTQCFRKHYLDYGSEFLKAISSGIYFANMWKSVTFGIIPDSEEIVYRYIWKGNKLNVTEVLTYVENVEF